MSNIKSILKENYKNIIIVACTVIMLPVISLITEIIYHYGTYVGTFIRNIVENGACF